MLLHPLERHVLEVQNLFEYRYRLDYRIPGDVSYGFQRRGTHIYVYV